MLVFQRKKYFGQYFLVSSTIKNLNEHIMGVYKVLWRSLCNLYDHFSGTLEVDQNKFSKIGYFPEKKQFGLIFSRITEYGRQQATLQLLVRRHKKIWQSLCKL